MNEVRKEFKLQMYILGGKEHFRQLKFLNIYLLQTVYFTFLRKLLVDASTETKKLNVNEHR